jgi:L-ascorbate peroxidase
MTGQSLMRQTAVLNVRANAAQAEANQLSLDEKREVMRSAQKAIKDIILSKNCNPIIVRLAWHDSGSYDKSIPEWPQRGGANGSIRFYPEIKHAANAGLTAALELLKEVTDKREGVSYADVFQLASATAIELAGGPKIPLRFGRRDARNEEDCCPEGRLPAGEGDPKQGWPNKASSAAEHLRHVFHRMGLDDKDIVALSGAHTLGRAKPSRSGFGKEETKYTKEGPGTPGGSSWTPEWLHFDNSYFTEVRDEKDPDLLVLSTDRCLFEDEGFRPHAEKYAADQDAFFQDYAQSHVKLSELGADWVDEPWTLD